MFFTKPRVITPLLGVIALFASSCGAPSPSSEDSESKTICGATSDFIPINDYKGEKEWVNLREEAVGRINYSCTGTYLGTVNGTERLFITAGHCLSRVGQAVRVEFNYEAKADGPVKAIRGTTLERADGPDYALVQLDAEPGIEPTPIGQEITNGLTIIQHPRGTRKVVATGTVRKTSSPSRIFYSDIDSLSGSSGSGVLNDKGEFVGVHTLGGCRANGGANSGWSIKAIENASAIL